MRKFLKPLSMWYLNDNVIKMAGDYFISTNERETINMLKAIISHPNQDDLIEDVNQVYVKSRVEGCYSCDGFIKELEDRFLKEE